MELHHKLRELREKLGVTQGEFGEKCGFKWSKIKDLESGKQKITLEIRQKISETFGVVPYWWENDGSPMFEKGLGESQTIPTGLVEPTGVWMDVRPDAALPGIVSYRKVPVISWARAGVDGFFEDSFPSGHGFTEMDIPSNITDPMAYGLEISGDSMSPKYEEGDYVLVSPAKGVVTGKDAVIKLKDGQILAKRIKSKNGVFVLQSLNQEYDDITVKAEDIVFMHRIVLILPR